MAERNSHSGGAVRVLEVWFATGGRSKEFDLGDVLEALADPDPGVDTFLRADREWPWLNEDLVFLVPDDALLAVPPRRLMLCGNVIDQSALREHRVGQVPPEDRDAFRRWLLDRLDHGGDGWAGNWFGRRDVFSPADVVSVVDRTRALLGDPTVVSAILVAGADPGPHRARALSLALEGLCGLADAERDRLLAELSDDTLTRMAGASEVGDAFERWDGERPLVALLRALATRPGRRTRELCLDLVSRMPEAGYAQGADIVQLLHDIDGVAARKAFRRALADEMSGIHLGTDAGQTMEALLASVLHVVLSGKVNVRPSTLNAVDTSVMRGREIPVFLDGAHVGVATTEQYPVRGTTDVRYEAELDADLVPAGWAGQEVSFARAVQGASWPGPPTVEIHLGITEDDEP